uniref:Uncharacterized protein n=1 Tax=Zea mays TaxID=4577 RepID=C4J8L9_MAIZE|nr:unknown [Zea mays]
MHYCIQTRHELVRFVKLNAKLSSKSTLVFSFGDCRASIYRKTCMRLATIADVVHSTKFVH